MGKIDVMEKKSGHYLVAAHAAARIDVSADRASAHARIPHTARNRGTVILIAVFVIALLSALVCGMLQMNTEEIQLMQNHIYAAEALAVAEAGLNDAFAQIRANDDWTAGFTNKSFAGHTYTVKVSGTLPARKIESTAATSNGYTAKVVANITVGKSKPYLVRIESLRINE